MRSSVLKNRDSKTAVQARTSTLSKTCKRTLKIRPEPLGGGKLIEHLCCRKAAFTLAPSSCCSLRAGWAPDTLAGEPIQAAHLAEGKLPQQEERELWVTLTR